MGVGLSIIFMFEVKIYFHSTKMYFFISSLLEKGYLSYHYIN